MDRNSAEIKSLEDIIGLMDGHMMKGYQSKLPKKESPLDANMSSESDASQSPADMAEASEQAPGGEPEMDDAAMQELMKMYEEEGTDEPADIVGLP
jgi:hypothetical protein